MTPAARACAVLALFVAAQGGAGAQPRRAAAGKASPPLPVLGEVPPFSFEDQEGHRLSNADLLGHAWVANFIFTQCRTACPTLTGQLAVIQRAVPDAQVRFVSFSVDPDHDTPAALKAYASRWQHDARWSLLATTKRALRPLLARLGVEAEPTGDPDDPIQHSNGFLLIDGSGLVRGMYSGEEAERLRQLAVDLRRLAHEGDRGATRPTVPLRSGEQLFAELGCGGCHADPHLASPLGGLFGRTVRLSDGGRIQVDDAYLRESITAPGAKVVAGYPPTMPSYAGVLSPAELDALIAYLAKLPAQAVAAAPREVRVDPVCHMQLSAGPGTSFVEHAGKRYFFCSEACRKKFEQDPARYTR